MGGSQKHLDWLAGAELQPQQQDVDQVGKGESKPTLPFLGDSPEDGL